MMSNTQEIFAESDFFLPSRRIETITIFKINSEKKNVAGTEELNMAPRYAKLLPGVLFNGDRPWRYWLNLILQKYPGQFDHIVCKCGLSGRFFDLQVLLTFVLHRELSPR